MESQFYFNDEQTDGSGTTGNAGGGIVNIPTPTPAPTSATNNTGCLSDSQCATGFYCDTDTVLGYADSASGGDPFANPIYGCRQIPVVPTPAPTVTVVPTPAPTVTVVPTPAPTVIDTCSPDGTIIRCVDQNGTVEVSTGTKVNGICATRQAFSGTCRVCPPPGTFLNCQGTFGNYAEFTPDYVAGPCGIVSVTNDPRCVIVAPAPAPTPPSSTYTTTLIASPSEGGSVSGTSNLTPTPSTVIVSRIGERVDFQAEAAPGYTFTGWELQGNSWSTNYSPAILSDKNQTYVARFTKNPTTDTCGCYFVAPTVAGQSFEITFRACVAGSTRQTQTISNFTNICSADIPAAGRNAQVPQNLGSQCSNTQTCGTPTVTTPTPSPITIVGPTPTPVPSPVPTPIPPPVIVPVPPRWRDCVSEELIVGTPTNRREVNYGGPGGGTCWEPLTTVTFLPSLDTQLLFQYQQGSTQYPTAQVVSATNASTALSYEIKITTNLDIAITPNIFTISPRSMVTFTIQPTPTLLNELAAGTSVLQMSVNIREL